MIMGIEKTNSRRMHWVIRSSVDTHTYVFVEIEGEFKRYPIVGGQGDPI
jgi:hypothetical protein